MRQITEVDVELTCIRCERPYPTTFVVEASNPDREALTRRVKELAREADAKMGMLCPTCEGAN